MEKLLLKFKPVQDKDENCIVEWNLIHHKMEEGVAITGWDGCF